MTRCEQTLLLASHEENVLMIPNPFLLTARFHVFYFQAPLRFDFDATFAIYGRKKINFPSKVFLNKIFFCKITICYSTQIP